MAARMLMLALLSLTAVCWSQPRQSAAGRIDLYVVGNAFDLSQARCSRGATVGSCSWLGAAKERTGLTCEKALGREWEQLWVEFVAQGTGQVDIDLQGEFYRREGPQDVRLVWADTVAVEGATILNPDFEEATADGLPLGWRFTGAFAPSQYSRDGSVAHSGKCCLATWYGSQARQAFSVETGKRYRVSAWFRVMDPSLVVAPQTLPQESPATMYTQELEITFATPDAAQRASLALLPLYDGYDWAMSSRWDDNNKEGDLAIQAVLAKHGHRGTFYLNETRPPVDGAAARALLEGGNSIGGHSLTHPFLGYVSRNRMFEEVAGIRADREASTDSLLVSFSFAFCNFRNATEGLPSQVDIGRILQRAGFYHQLELHFNDAVKTDILDSPIMPSDGQDIDAFARAALDDEAFKEDHPILSYSMHAWYKTPEAWAKFEKQLDDYGHNPDWWYCSQNQYAAYRYQYLHAKLEEPVREGSVLRVRLQRPVLLDLNDPTPLTLEVRGVPGEAVVGFTCPTAEAVPSARPSTAPRVNLSHDRTQALPGRIGITHNRDNHSALTEADGDPKFPQLQSLLCFADGKLNLTLDNRGDAPLSDVQVTYRLPLVWKEGVVRHGPQAVPAHGLLQDSLSPTRANEDYKCNSGPGFILAQVDFVQGAQVGRLYAACHVDSHREDPSYPQGRFLRLGPIPEAEFNLQAVSAALAAGQPAPEAWTLNDGTRLQWVADDSPNDPPYLDVEMVRTTGKWRGDERGPIVFLLRSVIHSDRPQPADLVCPREGVTHAFLRGAEVTTRTAQLSAGDNDLLLVYRQVNERFSPDEAGCFLRLVHPGTTERLTDLRFALPRPRAVD